jgi:hypothetical protein
MEDWGRSTQPKRRWLAFGVMLTVVVAVFAGIAIAHSDPDSSGPDPSVLPPAEQENLANIAEDLQQKCQAFLDQGGVSQNCEDVVAGKVLGAQFESQSQTDR